MDILDFLLAMSLLARITYDKKLRLMFELCDDDDDGCMKPIEILKMLQRIEHIFQKECSRVNIDSEVLLNSMADKKAEQNFHFIMGMIRHQTAQAKLEQALKEQAQKDAKLGSKTLSADQSKPPSNAHPSTSNLNAEKIKLLMEDIDEENLISYREFMLAIKGGLRDSLYKSILPRTLSF
mmetsp:Transcript_34295/g.25378  ORF Transcript_34295/g.25378 Transcript_34295/m.25378 type:complete len:180 (+) Transcript_34295:285-824(+)|eukprot:CAMPEP_0202968418 /NCGR_PEP_ID=MMETSP1396-20130829/13694_1 /ASSEMBLY_ACC=CAM_ASM_000872 /TAXON_ID= /ORGANISM="Pseudokeronopsis sp., Strain Brazil" /LENGTH=179 /DNA_ID=CAMNT_0049694695 /DNA_START=19 /DNA_END=558 /DNA_ORIENTATION=+